MESSDSAGVTNCKVTAIAKEGSRAGEEPAILHSRGRVDTGKALYFSMGAAVPPSMGLLDKRKLAVGHTVLGSRSGSETEELLGGERSHLHPGWARMV